jgi:uncharacterized membrane protein (UPF0136 family)
MQRIARLVGIYFMVYGGLVAVGGLIGLIRAGSWLSLLVGLFSGLLLILSGVATGRGKSVGHKMALVISLALLVWFGIRFWWTGKLMPAGLVSGMSLLALLLLGLLRLSYFVAALLERPK